MSLVLIYLGKEPLFISIQVPFIYSGDSVAKHMIVLAILSVFVKSNETF